MTLLMLFRTESSPLVAQDVASLIFVRTRTGSGELAGAFTDSTQPTAAEVQRLMALYAPLVLAQVGPVADLPPNDEARSAVSSLIAHYVAAAIEDARRPEEIDAGVSPAERLREVAKDLMPGVVKMVERAREATVPGGDAGIDSPQFSFGQPSARSDGTVVWPAARVGLRTLW